MNITHIGLVGYGEVGKIFSAGLRVQPGVASVAAWDLKLADPAHRDALQKHAAQAGVVAVDAMQALCARCDCIISAVTASNTLAVVVAEYCGYSGRMRMRVAPSAFSASSWLAMDGLP